MCQRCGGFVAVRWGERHCLACGWQDHDYIDPKAHAYQVLPIPERQRGFSIEEGYVTITQAAAALRVTTQTLYVRLSKGQIPGAIKPVKRWLIPQEFIDSEDGVDAALMRDRSRRRTKY